MFPAVKTAITAVSSPDSVDTCKFLRNSTLETRKGLRRFGNMGPTTEERDRVLLAPCVQPMNNVWVSCCSGFRGRLMSLDWLADCVPLFLL